MPVIPLSEGHALSMGVFSLHDSVTFSGYADPGVLPCAGRLPGAVEASVADLSRAVPRPRTRPLSARAA